MFTTKEAYHPRYSTTQTNKDQLWDQVWKPRIWPKVSTFLWLLSKRCILTWDNLQKRGFIGPSRCPNYNLNTESILHLMETCPLATQLWEKTNQCNRRSGKRRGDVTETIRKWPKDPYQSPLLNSLWNLIPGFLYWLLWKERNNRIFNNVGRSIDTLWQLLKQNLQETLAIRHWQETDLPDSPQERLIMNVWNLNLSSLAHVTARSPTIPASPLFWSPPTSNSFKLNFDGAAKGNPGLTSFGGVFRKEVGAVIHIYYGSIGKDTNNATKLEGLWRGICITDQKNFFPLEVEGDSLILINAATRIQAGTTSSKIASNWRLLSRLELLEERLRQPHSILFKHVKRTANKVADRLANQGVNQQFQYSGSLGDSDDEQLKHECTTLVQQDYSLLDAGDWQFTEGVRGGQVAALERQMYHL